MPSKSELYEQIKLIEKEIEAIKSAHNFGKISLADAKAELKELDAELMKFVNQLPEAEKQTYLQKKEFGPLNNWF